MNLHAYRPLWFAYRIDNLRTRTQKKMFAGGRSAAYIFGLSHVKQTAYTFEFHPCQANCLNFCAFPCQANCLHFGVSHVKQTAYIFALRKCRENCLHFFAFCPCQEKCLHFLCQLMLRRLVLFNNCCGLCTWFYSVPPRCDSTLLFIPVIMHMRMRLLFLSIPMCPCCCCSPVDKHSHFC